MFDFDDRRKPFSICEFFLGRGVNTVPIPFSLPSASAAGPRSIQTCQVPRFEDATGGNPEGTALNIVSPYPLLGGTTPPVTNLNSPLGAVIITMICDQPMRVSNNKGFTGLVNGGYAKIPANTPIQLPCAAEGSGAGPNQVAVTPNSAITSFSTTGNPEIYVQLDPTATATGSLQFFYGMLF